MKKHFLFFGFAMLLSVASAFAQDCDYSGTTGTLEWCLKDGTLTISGEGDMPDYVSNNPPWKPYSFNTVIIENGVTGIGIYAFAALFVGDYSYLTSITIPNSVTSIRDGAFSNCVELASITIPNSVTSIGEATFYTCLALTSITIPSSVTSIGMSVFIGCAALTSINVDSGNTNYSSDNGILFNKDKTAIICHPEGKTESSYDIPNSVTSIERNAFCGCRTLTSINIPNSVTHIKRVAFQNCTSLSSITIPESVTEIEDRAFLNCRSLEIVNFNAINCTTIIGGQPPYWDGLFSGDSAFSTLNIGDMVTTIGDRMFSRCYNLASVDFPTSSSVTTIGNEAFSGCAFTSIDIPNSVTTIGDWAFSSCPALTSINIPNSVTTIGDWAFTACSALTSIDIPNSVTTIGSGAFSYCSALTSIDIPNSITTIGSGAFSSCSALASIDIPNGVPAIEKGTFSRCEKLTSVIIPNSVKSIGEGYNMGEGAFQYCTDLSSITVLNLVPVEIGYTVFNDMYDPDIVDITAITLEVPTSAVPDYQAAEVWKEMIIVGGGMLVNPVPGDPKQGYTEGDGLYSGRATATVTAVPRNDYKFVNWTIDGVEVSKDNPYSFTVTEDIELVANFEEGVGIVETWHAASLQVYPNPTSGKLTITCYRHCGLDPQSSENNEIAGQARNDIHGVDVFDVMGRVVHVGTQCIASLQSEIGQFDRLTALQSEIEINISHLPAGVYFLRITTENGVVTRKVVKE